MYLRLHWVCYGMVASVDLVTTMSVQPCSLAIRVHCIPRSCFVSAHHPALSRVELYTPLDASLSWPRCQDDHWRMAVGWQMLELTDGCSDGESAVPARTADQPPPSASTSFTALPGQKLGSLEVKAMSYVPARGRVSPACTIQPDAFTIADVIDCNLAWTLAQSRPHSAPTGTRPWICTIYAVAVPAGSSCRVVSADLRLIPELWLLDNSRRLAHWVTSSAHVFFVVDSLPSPHGQLNVWQLWYALIGSSRRAFTSK